MQSSYTKDFDSRMKELLLKMLLVNDVINHSTYKKVLNQHKGKESV